MGGYVVPETNDRADDAYEAARQEATDNGEDWLGLEAKRSASGNSPEQLSIQDAYIEGQRAGANGLAAGLNPYQHPGLPEWQAWERGRNAAEAYRTNRSFA